MVALAVLAVAALSASSSAVTVTQDRCALNVPIQPNGERRPMTAFDLARLRDIGTPDSSLTTLPSPLSLSPDRETVAFVISQADPATNSFCRALATIEIRPGAALQVLDQGGEMIISRYDIRGIMVATGSPETIIPKWSPDGRALAWLRRDNGTTQLWCVSARGGDAAPVTVSPVDVETWAWASNTELVTVSAPQQLDELAQIAHEGRTGWLYDARFTPQTSSRPQVRANLPREYRTYRVDQRNSRPATPREIALVAQAANTGVAAAEPAVAPNGARAWLEAEGSPFFGSDRVHISGPNTARHDCTHDACAGRILALGWHGGGSDLIYLKREGWAESRSAFYRWRPGRSQPVRLSATSDILLGCVPRLSTFLCLREASTKPRSVVEIDTKSGRSTTIYDPNPEFAAIDFGSVRRLEMRNDRALPFYADLVLPPKYRPGDRLPLVVVQYQSDGFLRGGTGDEYPIYPLAARGFAVLSIDRPSSVARAMAGLQNIEDVARAEQHDWAERRSMLSATLRAVRHVVKLGIADPKRLGISGLSDGATAARFALINNKAFAAAAISSSAIEPNTTMTYGGIAWADENRRLGFPRASSNDRKFWMPMSLALNAATVNVPLLIQASDDEYLTSLETFTALREHGKPVELIVYPGEHHIKWQPAHKLAVYERAIDWFDFWLRGAVDRNPAKAAQYVRWRAMATGGSLSLPAKP